MERESCWGKRSVSGEMTPSDAEQKPSWVLRNSVQAGKRQVPASSGKVQGMQTNPVQLGLMEREGKAKWLGPSRV